MKIIKLSALIFITLIVFISCQKQLDFETDGISVGSLKSTITGDCLPVTVNGSFKVDSVLTAANYVDVQVDVSKEGTFDIKSDTVNGYSFSKAGNVAKGLNTVRLSASGKPLTAGNNIFTIKYGTSSCTFVITVTAAGTGVAVYSLGGSPGGCTGFIVNGTYTAGSILSAANSVSLQVNVVSIGTYTISTNTVNGISFSKAGTFSVTGPQVVIIAGAGTPTAGGNFNFSVTAATSSCSFSLTVNTTTVTNIDYIPETSFSNWSNKLVGGAAGDTTYVQVSPNTSLINGITYKIFEVKNLGNPVDSFYHHKNGGMYYQLYNGNYGIFDNPFNKDGLILDSSLAVNATWTIALGTNTVSGIPVTVKINCQIIAKGTTASVAGNNYSNIIKVKYSYVGNIGLGDTIYAEEERWYARGFGLIYDKLNDVPVTTTTELETTRIQIF